MPERIEKLNGIIKELEAELESLDTVDAQSQQVLKKAIEDLRTALGKTDSASLDSASLESESLIAQLRSAEADFELSHPTVSGLVMRMINALAQLGI